MTEQSALTAEPDRCRHDLTEQDTAVANGMCPLCLRADIERLAQEHARLGREFADIVLAMAEDKPLVNGEYPHLVHCSANRLVPLGTLGSGCVCNRGRKQAEARCRELAAEVLYLAPYSELLAQPWVQALLTPETNCQQKS